MKLFDLEEYKKNPTRRVVTKCGYEARIICTDAKMPRPIVALVEKNDSYIVQRYAIDGTCGEPEKKYMDLILYPEEREGWVNMYLNERGRIFFGQPYSTKEEALDEPYDDKNTRVYTKKVKWEG